MVFPIVTYGCESWTIKKAKGWSLCLWTVVLGRTLENPLDSKEIKPVNLEWNQSWIFIGRADTDPEAPVLCQPDANSQFIGKDPDTWKDWGQKEKKATENEMVGWHPWCNGHELGQTLGDAEGQGCLACYSPGGWEGFDTTWLLNNSQYRGL